MDTGVFRTIYGVFRDNKPTFVAIVAGLSAVIAAVVRADGLIDGFRTRLVENITLAPDPQKAGAFIAVPSALMVYGLAVSLAAGVFFGVASVALLVYGARLRRGTPRSIALQKAYDAVLTNALKIVRKAYPPQQDPPWVFEKVSISVFVNENGDTTLNREDHVRADDGPLRYWEQEIAGEDDSHPVDFLEELGFQLKDEGGNEVAYLVTANEPTRKSVAVFHLPELTPAEPAARIIKSRYTWPRFDRKLSKTGKDDWAWELRSRKRIPVVEFQVCYAKAVGKVSCEVINARVPGDKLEAVELGEGAGWKYTVPDCRADGFELFLRFKTAP